MSVTPRRIGLDGPGEAGVAPLRGGEAWIGRKPPSPGSGLLSDRTAAAQVATPPRKQYRGGNHRGAGAAEVSREGSLLPSSASPLPPPLPTSLPLPPPGSECPCAPRAGAAARAASPGPSPSPHSPPPPRRARRSRRRGRWRRPPAPAGPRGRSEEPEEPLEASREDAAAEDEPAERAVSPVSAGPARMERSGPRAGGMEPPTQRWCIRGGGRVAVSSLPGGRWGLEGPRARRRSGRTGVPGPCGPGSVPAKPARLGAGKEVTEAGACVCARARVAGSLVRAGEGARGGGGGDPECRWVWRSLVPAAGGGGRGVEVAGAVRNRKTGWQCAHLGCVGGWGREGRRRAKPQETRVSSPLPGRSAEASCHL